MALAGAKGASASRTTSHTDQARPDGDDRADRNVLPLCLAREERKEEPIFNGNRVKSSVGKAAGSGQGPRALWIAGLGLGILALLLPSARSTAGSAPAAFALSGRLEDPQHRPVVGPDITAMAPGSNKVLGRADQHSHRRLRRLSFSDFLGNQTMGVVLALLAAAGFVLFFYRHEWRKQSGGISPRLYERMRENARLEDPHALWRAAVVFVMVLVGFVLGEQIHIVPAVPALVGATVLLVWLTPDVQKMIKAVDWTTLVFFIAIFIVIGAVQEVGLVSLIAGAASRLIGDHFVLGIFAILFGVGTFSVAIANIPLMASMLPIVEFLSGSTPGANSKVLHYALSMGAAMGGNGFRIGGEANIVTAGISEQAGTPISFAEFLRIGLPVTYLTMGVGFLGLLARFVLFAS
jgi:di/tricarboxylate transporter